MLKSFIFLKCINIAERDKKQLCFIVFINIREVKQRSNVAMKSNASFFVTKFLSLIRIQSIFFS